MIYFIIFLILVFLSPYFRCLVLHPFSSVFYIFYDLYRYIRYRKWNEFKDYGKIICATALFGGGKTLTSTVYLRYVYHRFNNKTVYNPRLKKWVKQRIYIHSNVHFNDINYISLRSTQEMLQVTKDFCDDNFMDIHLFFIDEASTQFNSRQFKENFNPNLLNTILTCRHVKIGIILTSQRFNHVDALLRQVTSETKECSHLWRLYKLSFYDAYMLENCSNPTLIKPTRVRTLFIRDKDYAAYDTFAIVNNLVKASDSGDMEDEATILALRDYQDNVDASFYMSKHNRKKYKGT